jgi:hypothetical protein
VPAKSKPNSKEYDTRAPRRNRPSRKIDDATALPDPPQSRKFMSKSNKDPIVDACITSVKVIGDEEMGELVSSMSAYDPFYGM